MKVDLIRTQPLQSSFLSCEKDTETILRRLFVESNPFSDDLKRLLVINTPDCLDNRTNEAYNKKIKEMDLYQLKKQGYIKLDPIIRREEHGEVKSFIMITFDNFTPNATNPVFRDCMVHIDVICHNDCWDLGNYRMRPLKICGYIDALLNNTKLSGIGKFLFAGCTEIVLDEVISGYSLLYNAVHWTDDTTSKEDE